MDDIDEETAPPQAQVEEEFRPYYPEKVEDEGVLTKEGLKKKLIKVGEGWDAPLLGDEVTVHFTGSVVGGEKFASSKDKGEPFVFNVGKYSGAELRGCDDGIITMRLGEIALFTVPPKLTQGIQETFPSIAADATLQFEIELISWLKVVDVCEDGGIIKKILHRTEAIERAKEKDEVTVKYEVKLDDGTVVAKSPEDGVEFVVHDGQLCPAIAKAVVTMRKGEKAVLTVQPQYGFGEKGRPATDDQFPAIPPNAVLTIFLELVAFKLLEYITEDKKVIKKITCPMETFEKPNSGAVAHIRYVGKLSDGTIFDKKGHDGEEPLEFLVDEDTQYEGKLAVVPAHSTLYYEVEMVDFTKVKESWDMEPEEKIEYAGRRKEEGNAYFKAGKYERASLRFDMAVKYVEFESTFSEEQKKIGKFFKVTCSLNNAACKLKLKKYREAAKLCTNVLKLESQNVKALFRRAQAYIETTDFDLAELDLKKALEIDPDNRELKSEYARLKKLQAYYDKKDSKLYASMVEKLRLSDGKEEKKLVEVN
ncbi:peptidyl-prolyl cis-trans isomerase FKBP65-like isoform X2 [Nymphaea colorata]|uniref:peptidyl-prolyl cis-trans isomerase FKBP65-like isoform X2 n=1 Tax=Nymphaea colorata TaxID=210225 RepID=UPI00214E98E7|nr:peptidyl-prolyl cis-trans isomerase FKBP65-like isoform X2 [Nymphaea colorata]